MQGQNFQAANLSQIDRIGAKSIASEQSDRIRAKSITMESNHTQRPNSSDEISERIQSNHSRTIDRQMLDSAEQKYCLPAIGESTRGVSPLVSEVSTVKV